MNNKRLGNNWEKQFTEILASKGFWVHFITPNIAGQQPFDIIAVKDNRPYAIDCKTAVKPIFPLSRLEDNQVNAFELWLQCGNDNALVAVKYGDKYYQIPYDYLKIVGKVDLRKWGGEDIDI